MRRLVFVPVLLVATAAALAAQRSDAPAFEVASIRLAPGRGATSQRMTDTRVDLAFVSLRAVLLMAFRAKPYELVGPDWLAETRVTIQATMPPEATRQQVPEMLQRLLAERFGLVVHREPRPMDVQELVVSPGGHKMQEVEAMDELDKTFPVSRLAEQLGTAAGSSDTVRDTPDGPVRTVREDYMASATLTARTMYRVAQMNVDNLRRRSQTLDATRMTMAELVSLLATNMDQPVLDKTGLRGIYRFSVELPLDARVIESLAKSPLGAEATLELPNISAAKAESLGLRLERRRAPIDVIVVDKIEPTPTSN
jgi:uncharacterized protein (TIGR03435 family)